MRNGRKPEAIGAGLTVPERVADAVVTRVVVKGLIDRDAAVVLASAWCCGGDRSIPFVKFGGLKFLDSAHVKDVLTSLRWA